MCTGKLIDDAENGGGQMHMDFEEDFTRRNFIKKVYLILTAQLVVTIGIVATLATLDEFYDYVEMNPSIFLVAMIIMFVTVITLICCSKVRRTVPFNFIFLGIFTLAESFLLSVLCSKYDPMIVLTALGVTAAISLVLSLYAMQTKFDFTAMGSYLLVFLVITFIFGILVMFFHTKLMMMIYCWIGVLLFSMFLIYDTQLMMGGDHAYSISPDEYIFAALNLYIDIVQLFLFLLHIIGGDN